MLFNEHVDVHAVLAAVIDQWNHGIFPDNAIDLYLPDAFSSTSEKDVVEGVEIAVMDPKGAPGLRHGRLKPESRGVPPHSNKSFHEQAIHPPCGTGVPGPTATAGMRRHGIYIGGDYVRFHTIYANIGGVGAVPKGID